MLCETCGYVCVHSGGEATCTKGAVCETCGKEYTDKDMANHSGKLVWVQTEKTHKQAYDCCDKEVSTSEAHGWKTVYARFVIISVNTQVEVQHV